MVRLWWNSSEKRVFNIVDRFTSKYVSSVLSLQEISAVQTSTQLFNGMTVSMLLGSLWESGFKCGVWCRQQVCPRGQDSPELPPVLAGSRVAGPSADMLVVQSHQPSPPALIGSQKLVLRHLDGHQGPVPAVGSDRPVQGRRNTDRGFCAGTGQWHVGRKGAL